MKLLFPDLNRYAIEINTNAVSELKKELEEDNIYPISILDFLPKQKFDLVLIKGVLIHINPEYLSKVYESLYNSTGKYLLISEYYNPTPVSINYRGHSDLLFKRDFCGEIMDKYPKLHLINYGFVYHRDLSFPMDDGNWFLLELRE